MAVKSIGGRSLKIDYRSKMFKNMLLVKLLLKLVKGSDS